MKKIDYSFHMHTYRCGHARVIEDEMYITNAIKAGYHHIGFSDHAMFPNYSQKGVRGDYQEYFEDYINTIKGLKKKYQSLIDIKVGFEAEYSDEFVKYYQGLLSSGTLDYLILGQHFHFEDGTHPWYFRGENEPRNIYRYAEDLLKGMSSGLFKYVAHPDLYMQEFTYFSKDCEVVARMICEASNKYHLPLEINLEGMRDHKHYPCYDFWKVVKEYNCDVVIGLDLHDPDNFFDDYSMKKALDLVDELGLKLITDYKI